MNYWDDECLTSIIKSYEKLIIPADEIGGGSDYLIIKLGILTNKKNWTNAEIAVNDGSTCFNIGLVEFDHQWNPFPCPTFVNDNDGSDEPCDSNGDDSSYSAKEGSDTDNMEEGEIPEYSDSNGNPKMETVLETVDIPSVLKSKKSKAVENVEYNHSTPSHASFSNTKNNSGTRRGGGNMDTASFSNTNNNSGTRRGRGNMDNASFSNTNNNSGTRRGGGNMDNLIQSGLDPLSSSGPNFPFNSFGLFPLDYSPQPSGLGGPINLVADKEPLVCRRKGSTPGNKFSPYIQRIKPRRSFIRGADNGNIDNMPEIRRSLDLNVSVPSPSAMEASQDNEDCTSSTDEIRKTVGIGIEVGFQIELGDPMVAQIIGEQGEIIGQP
ncbi:hypothetical protein LXL04_032568 [Taraxacum kok-saghyz]